MKALKITALTILLILFVASGILFILGKGAEKTLLKKDFYQNAVEEVELSPVAVSTLNDYTTKQLDLSGTELPQETKDRIKQAVRDSISETITEEWTEETTMLVVKDVLAYIKGEQENLKAVVDLGEKKEAMRSSLKAKMQQMIESETERQLQERDIPPGMEERVKQQVRSEVSSRMGIIENVFTEVPNKIVLADVLEDQEFSQKQEQNIAQFNQLYNLFHNYSHWILIILAVVILAVAGVGTGLTGIGVGMLVSGLSVFLSLFIAERSLRTMVTDWGSNLKWEQINILLDPFLSQMYQFVWIYSGIGLALLVIGVVWKKYKH